MPLTKVDFLWFKNLYKVVPLLKTKPIAYNNKLNCLIQVNYLSPLFLTLELMPNILEAASSVGDARIIFVSSNSHRFVSWDPENFNPVEEGYGRLKTYSLTKMYNVSMCV